MSPTSSLATMTAAARRTSPGLRPYWAAFARSTVTLNCGTSVCRSMCSLTTPSMPPRSVLHLLRLLAQGVQVRTEQADDDRLAAAGDDLLGALVQVGLAVAEEAGVVSDDLVDGRDRLVVVDVGSMLIQFSPKLMPYGSSPWKAWPRWAPKLRTPGMAISSSLAARVMRCISWTRCRAGQPSASGSPAP